MSESEEEMFDRLGIPVVGMDDLGSKLANLNREGIKNMKRDRPYNGQVWTNMGKRGKTEVTGLTMRDIRDCYIRAVLLSASHLVPDLYTEADKGEDANICGNDLYGFDLDKLDPIAISQNLTCEIERMMGIFPNVEPAFPDKELP